MRGGKEGRTEGGRERRHFCYNIRLKQFFFGHTCSGVEQTGPLRGKECEQL